MYICGYLLKAAVTHLNGRLKTILPFGAFNLTLPYSSIQDDMLQTNISYSRVLHDFLKSTSRRYFNEPYTFGYKGCCWQVLQSNDPIASVSDASTNQQLEKSLEFEILILCNPKHSPECAARTRQPRKLLNSKQYIS